MKLTAQLLRQIIKEEASKALNEAPGAIGGPVKSMAPAAGTVKPGGDPTLNNLQLTYPKLVGRVLRSKQAEAFMLDLDAADEAESLSILVDYLEAVM